MLTKKIDMRKGDFPPVPTPFNVVVQFNSLKTLLRLGYWVHLHTDTYVVMKYDTGMPNWCLKGYDDIRDYWGGIYDLHVPSYMYAHVSDALFTFDTDTMR